MAAAAATNTDVLGFALDQGAAGLAAGAAEDALMALRERAPDMPAAVAQALTDATGTADGDTPAHRTARAIAAAVERHGAGFPPGTEPPYHDRLHQAEATRALGWLLGAARRLGHVTPADAALAIAAMAAHDLLHDGRVHAERGLLERRSAEAAATIAADQGMSAADIATLRRIILATTWPWDDAEAPDLPCRLAREADLFASSLPRLGPRLSRLLARELAMAGQAVPEGVATHVARVALLRLLPPASEAARALGLDGVRAAQLDAYGEAARRLGLRIASAEAGAAALDAMDTADADALLAWSGLTP
ncbi:hypothetical protein [Roseomonas fluvialis]|uniref:Uncharacterized protein n=1 Tax=Roseomonas fluvialis TaxID=1750527 RepID=A0ABN6P1U5_9PROT|nr:hypothetical protein [Roseomonas fluvialis]BDG72632.1 hypothetical protein Rmf_25610 [Roseomonas fluvialis]